MHLSASTLVKISLAVVLLANSTFAGVDVDAGAESPRRIQWWMDIVDDRQFFQNYAIIKEHRAAFSTMQPNFNFFPLDGNLTYWWQNEKDIFAYTKPLNDISLPVLPYLVDIDNSTQMHLVYQNQSAFISDAVSIAKHFNFSGWFIDYEDEYPSDTDPHAVARLVEFLNALGEALHKEGLRLTICVADWSHLLSDYQSLAAAGGLDELQQMQTYGNDDFKSIIDNFFGKVKAGSGNLSKAGIGLGPYQTDYWTEDKLKDIIAYVVQSGGSVLDIFRLEYADEQWPPAYWWPVLESFAQGTAMASPAKTGRFNVRRVD